ncbi:MAG: hypothetical protein DRI22_00200 [Caldiserica bacterium]|nr:MAG: hypothetical protein DRI22_00200 [Caldisericota bacterium]
MEENKLREILRIIMEKIEGSVAIYISDPNGFMVEGISLNGRVHEEIPMSISLSIREMFKMESFFYKEEIRGIIVEKEIGSTYIVPFLNGRYILSIFGDDMNIGLVKYVVDKYRSKILELLKERL